MNPFHGQYPLADCIGAASGVGFMGYLFYIGAAASIHGATPLGAGEREVQLPASTVHWARNRVARRSPRSVSS